MVGRYAQRRDSGSIELEPVRRWRRWHRDDAGLPVDRLRNGAGSRPSPG